jgi:hypothetical protein
MELKKVIYIYIYGRSKTAQDNRTEKVGGDRKPRKIKIILCTVHHCAHLTFHRTQF